LKEFFKAISPTLAEKVSLEIFLEVFKNNLQLRTAMMIIGQKFLEDNPYPKRNLHQAEELLIRPIVTKMTPELVQPDHVIIEKL